MKMNLPSSSSHLKLGVGGCCFLLLLSITGALGGGGGPPLQGEIPIGFYSGEDELPQESSQLVYQEEETYRLPLSVQPIHYDLEIRPILDSTGTDQFTAPGKVAILVKCFQSTDSITLHSKDIDIDHDAITVVAVDPAGSVGVNGHSVDEPRGFYIIGLDRNLTVDRDYLVTIPFTTPIPQDRLDGLYVSSYVASDGTRKYLATTQFQKDDASRAFPCFDEPSEAFRATFNVKIGRKAVGFHSLANTERVGDPEPIPGLTGWVWDNHAPTVNMPPYLIAIIVSDFVNETAPADLYPKPVRTWAQPTLMTDESGKFSAQAAARILAFFEEYFDYPYQLSKMDSVAVPDFAAGAMENWGLNTYRINLMVWLKEENTYFERWRSSAVIAHELAHQWFGNLVTCEWWNDTWLNEGFARYLQFIAANHSGMDFRSLDRYVVDATQLAMDNDVLSTTEPVHSNVTDRIVNQNSRIVYEKAAALIRMMQSFLTEETLIKGLRNYLKRHEYGGVVQDDLFQALTEQAEADRTFTQYTVKEVMDTWTLQSGFPVVRVSKITKTRLYISQEKFKLNPQEPAEAEWYVPISYVTASNPDFSPENTGPKDWLDKDTILKSLTVDDADQWIIVNPEARGYYRVIYDDALTQLILDQLERDHTVIGVGSRSQLIDDHFKSANAKYINIRTAMDMTRYLSKELDFIVWTTFVNNLVPLSTRLVDTPAFDNFKEYVLGLIMEPLGRIGGNQGPQDIYEFVVLRTMLLDWACSMGHEFCGQTATPLIAAWQAADPADPVPVPTDIQPMVYCGAVAASTTNNDIQNFLLQQYTVNRGTRQQTLIVNALACDQVPGNLQALMTRALNEDPANELDLATHGLPLLERIAMSSVGRPLLMPFIAAQRTEINRIYGQLATATLISRMAPYISSESANSFREAVDDFITAYLAEPNVPENVRNSLVASQRRIAENSEWMDSYYRDLSDWLTPVSP